MSKVHIKKNVHMHKPVHNNSNVCDLTYIIQALHYYYYYYYYYMYNLKSKLCCIGALMYTQTAERERERGSSFYQAVYFSALSGPGGDVTLVKYSSLFLL